MEDQLLCYCGLSHSLSRMEALFTAARSVGRHRCRISLASPDEAERRYFCAHSRPKRPLSGLDLSDFADLRGFSGNLSDATLPRLDCRWFISRDLEQTWRFLSQTSFEPCRARSDRAFRRRHLFVFIRSYFLRNANPVRWRVHVFRNLDHLVNGSVLLLPGNLTERTQGGCLWNCNRGKRFSSRFAEAEFYAYGGFCGCSRNLVNSQC